MLNIEDAMING